MDTVIDVRGEARGEGEGEGEGDDVKDMVLLALEDAEIDSAGVKDDDSVDVRLGGDEDAPVDVIDGDSDIVLEDVMVVDIDAADDIEDDADDDEVLVAAAVQVAV